MVLRSEDGLHHVISDGPSPSRLYALCDILETAERDRRGIEEAVAGAMMGRGARTHVKPVPDRNWGQEDVVDAIPSCLVCITTLREAIRG